LIISELIKDGNNVLVKDNLANTVTVFASNGTYAHAFECDDKTIYLNTSPSIRGIDASKLVIDITTITIPAPPVGGWTQALFLQELNDNFLNCPLDVNAVVNIPAGLATEVKQDAQITLLTEISFKEKLLQVDSVGNTTYIGYAITGALTSSAVWAIKRIIESGGDASINWASSSKDFNNIWDNRLSLTYG